VNGAVDRSPSAEHLETVRRRAAAVEQMCALLAREVADLSAQVTELVERPATAPLSVSVDDAARLLGVGRSTMFSLLESGDVRSVKVGARRLVPRRALEELLAAGDSRQVG
jgi:excisionase family DNA binding protein